MFRIPCNSWFLSSWFPFSRRPTLKLFTALPCDQSSSRVLRQPACALSSLNAIILTSEPSTSESIGGKFLRLNLHFLFSYQCDYDKNTSVESVNQLVLYIDSRFEKILMYLSLMRQYQEPHGLGTNTTMSILILIRDYV